MLVRPVVKRLFFPWKTKEKRLASLARLIMIGTVTVYRLPIRLPAKSALTWPVV